MTTRNPTFLKGSDAKIAPFPFEACILHDLKKVRFPNDPQSDCHRERAEKSLAGFATCKLLSPLLSCRIRRAETLICSRQRMLSMRQNIAVSTSENL